MKLGGRGSRNGRVPGHGKKGQGQGQKEDAGEGKSCKIRRACDVEAHVTVENVLFHRKERERQRQRQIWRKRQEERCR